VRSKLLRVMLASALNARVRTVEREESGAAGAVMMAAVQQKLYPDMAAAAKAWVDPLLSEATHPNPALVKIYRGLYPLYRDMRSSMKPAWRGHAALKRG
jgi:erythritol kinase (D-erythritol 1-phosphate-forming)